MWSQAYQIQREGTQTPSSERRRVKAVLQKMLVGWERMQLLLENKVPFIPFYILLLTLTLRFRLTHLFLKEACDGSAGLGHPFVDVSAPYPFPTRTLLPSGHGHFASVLPTRPPPCWPPSLTFSSPFRKENPFIRHPRASNLVHY